MEVILLERVDKLGQMGEVVRVRNGFARNYLLPAKRALRATEANRARFERDRATLEVRNEERKTGAEAIAADLDGKSFIVIRQAGETGQLYGSVSGRDVAEFAREAGFAVDRAMVALEGAIKTLGVHPVEIVLHADVRVTVTLNVARSQDEAQLQAEGVDVLAREADEDEADRAEMFSDIGAAAEGGEDRD